MSTTLIENNAAQPAVSDPPKKSKRKRLLVLLVALLAVATGGYMFLGHGKAKKPGPPEPGAVVALDPITINLDAGHYLRVGLALQLAKDKTLSNDPNTTDPAAAGARADDEAISVFGGESVANLTGTARDRLKIALLNQIKSDYAGAVIDLYFTEFVMQ